MFWSEAYKTVLDNFTEEEQSRVHKLARELEGILLAVKKRQQERSK